MLLCNRQGRIQYADAAGPTGKAAATAFSFINTEVMPMTFDEMCEFEVLYNAFLAARRGKKSKYSAAQYEANVLQLTERLSYILRTRKYVPRKFEVFYVREPKLRLVQARRSLTRWFNTPSWITSSTSPSRTASSLTTTPASGTKALTTGLPDSALQCSPISAVGKERRRVPQVAWLALQAYERVGLR